MPLPPLYSTGLMSNFGFPKTARVIRGNDFTEIIRRGPHAADDVVVVNARWNPRGAALLATIGISIPKKTGNAVVRNRWKRWIRESFRSRRAALPLGVEIIVRPKRDAVGSFAAVDRTLAKTVARAVKKLPPRAEADPGC